MGKLQNQLNNHRFRRSIATLACISLAFLSAAEILGTWAGLLTASGLYVFVLIGEAIYEVIEDRE